MAKYQFKLDYYKQNFGRKPVPYTEEGGLYFFTDSTTFDIKTQEFVFKETADTTAFDVRLIAIPVSSLSNEADEVMLHINVAGATPNYDARLQLQLHDVFESDKFDLSDKLLQPKDSVAMQLFFEGLLDKKVDFSIVARGNGVGEWNGVKVKKTNPQEEEENYSSDKMDESYRRLRLSEVYINLGREIQLEINSFTDPVQSNLKLENSELANQMTSNNWSKNEMLSAMRTLTILRKLKNEVNTLAGQYLSRTDAKIVIDRFNKEVQKTKISVGTNSLKVKI